MCLGCVSRAQPFNGGALHHRRSWCQGLPWSFIMDAENNLKKLDYSGEGGEKLEAGQHLCLGPGELS